jgi:hypothetical protein
VLGSSVNVRFYDNLGTQAASPLDGSVKLFNLEPQQHAMSGRGCLRVDEVRMVFLVPSVQLEKQFPRARDPIVYVTVAVFGQRVRPQ